MGGRRKSGGRGGAALNQNGRCSTTDIIISMFPPFVTKLAIWTAIGVSYITASFHGRVRTKSEIHSRKSSLEIGTDESKMPNINEVKNALKEFPKSLTNGECSWS